MAFDASALSPIYMGGKGGQKVWSYITTDDPLTVASEGYFVLEDVPVQAGDFFIIAHVDDVNAPSTATSISISCVTSVENKVAAINNQSGGDLLASNNLSDLVDATLARINLGIPLNKYDATQPPGATNDSSEGYSAGSEYAVPSLSEVYLCLDPTENNAVWLKTSSVSTIIKNTYDATSAPTVNHDTTQGYSVGSKLLDTSNDHLWICFDATEGAADWRKVSGTFAGLDELPDNSVTSGKVANGSITSDKLADGVIQEPTGKNLIINGNFDVWQRGTSHSTQGYGSADRWYLHLSGATALFSRQEFSLGQTDVPNNPKYFARLNVTSGDDWINIHQKIEGVRTLAGETVTLSFWAKHTNNGGTGLIARLGQSFGSGGSPSDYVSYAPAGTPTFSTTTTWQKFEYQIDLGSVAGKTLGSHGNDSLNLVISNSGNEAFDLDIAQVKLEVGDTATSFGYEDPTETLLKCKRYYNVDGEGSGNLLISWVPDVNNTSARALFYQFPVPMRVPPSASTESVYSWAANNVKETSCWFSANAPHTGTTAGIYKVILDAEI